MKLNWGTTMPFLEKFLHNKRDTMRSSGFHGKILIFSNPFLSKSSSINYLLPFILGNYSKLNLISLLLFLSQVVLLFL